MLSELREGTKSSWKHLEQAFSNVDANSKYPEGIGEAIESYKTAREILKIYMDVILRDIDLDSYEDVVFELEYNRRSIETYLSRHKDERSDDVERAKFILKYYNSLIEKILKVTKDNEDQQ